MGLQCHEEASLPRKDLGVVSGCLGDTAPSILTDPQVLALCQALGGVGDREARSAVSELGICWREPNTQSSTSCMTHSTFNDGWGRGLVETSNGASVVNPLEWPLEGLLDWSRIKLVAASHWLG